jgi:hypothetical protein
MAPSVHTPQVSLTIEVPEDPLVAVFALEPEQPTSQEGVPVVSAHHSTATTLAGQVHVDVHAPGGIQDVHDIVLRFVGAVLCRLDVSSKVGVLGLCVLDATRRSICHKISQIATATGHQAPV